MKNSERIPYDDAPTTEPRYGQPDDRDDRINQYGTYNIQPTADTENTFPMIAPGLPDEWRRMVIDRWDLDAEE